MLKQLIENWSCFLSKEDFLGRIDGDEFALLITRPITESLFIREKDKVVNILNQIESLGITIALDDFGTSYSSLSYLKDPPFDVIKIDKVFVDAILEDKKKAQLVDTILTIARQMDYKVVAEGVETTKQLHYLTNRSCDYIQGYLWGKPIMLDAVGALLSEIHTMTS